MLSYNACIQDTGTYLQPGIPDYKVILDSEGSNAG